MSDVGMWTAVAAAVVGALGGLYTIYKNGKNEAKLVGKFEQRVVDLAAEFVSFKEDIKEEMVNSDNRLSQRMQTLESRVDACVTAVNEGKKV